MKNCDNYKKKVLYELQCLWGNIAFKISVKTCFIYFEIN